MQLAHQILSFFHAGKTQGGTIYPYSFLEFIEKNPEIGNQVYNNLRYTRRLEQEGLLLNTGKQGDHPYYNDTYFTNKGEYNPDLSLYGSYDFLVNGFLSVRDRFKTICLPISVQKQNGDLSIGSSFVYSHNTIITARHCIEGCRSFQILREEVPISVNEVYFPSDENLDLAVIKTPDNFFHDFHSFSLAEKPEWKGTSPVDELNFIGEPTIVFLGQGKVLEDVLTLGYPPIAGFEAILIADKTSINSTFLRSSIGQVLTEQKKFYGDVEYFLINAKVKGGNSGGPVFDRLGCVIGIIIEIPGDFKNPEEVDKLGYGLVVPARYIKDLLTAIMEANPFAHRRNIESVAENSYVIQ